MFVCKKAAVGPPFYAGWASAHWLGCKSHLGQRKFAVGIVALAAMAATDPVEALSHLVSAGVMLR